MFGAIVVYDDIFPDEVYYEEHRKYLTFSSEVYEVTVGTKVVGEIEYVNRQWDVMDSLYNHITYKEFARVDATFAPATERPPLMVCTPCHNIFLTKLLPNYPRNMRLTRYFSDCENARFRHIPLPVIVADWDITTTESYSDSSDSIASLEAKKYQPFPGSEKPE